MYFRENRETRDFKRGNRFQRNTRPYQHSSEECEHRKQPVTPPKACLRDLVGVENRGTEILRQY